MSKNTTKQNKSSQAEQDLAELRIAINRLDALVYTMSRNIEKKKAKDYEHEDIGRLIKRLASAFCEIDSIMAHLGIDNG